MSVDIGGGAALTVTIPAEHPVALIRRFRSISIPRLSFFDAGTGLAVPPASQG